MGPFNSVRPPVKAPIVAPARLVQTSAPSTLIPPHLASIRAVLALHATAGNRAIAQRLSQSGRVFPTVQRDYFDVDPPKVAQLQSDFIAKKLSILTMTRDIKGTGEVGTAIAEVAAEPSENNVRKLHRIVAAFTTTHKAKFVGLAGGPVGAFFQKIVQEAEAKYPDLAMSVPTMVGVSTPPVESGEAKDEPTVGPPPTENEYRAQEAAAEFAKRMQTENLEALAAAYKATGLLHVIRGRDKFRRDEAELRFRNFLVFDKYAGKIDTKLQELTLGRDEEEVVTAFANKLAHDTGALQISPELKLSRRAFVDQLRAGAGVLGIVSDAPLPLVVAVMFEHDKSYFVCVQSVTEVFMKAGAGMAEEKGSDLDVKAILRLVAGKSTKSDIFTVKEDQLTFLTVRQRLSELTSNPVEAVTTRWKKREITPKMYETLFGQLGNDLMLQLNIDSVAGLGDYRTDFLEVFPELEGPAIQEFDRIVAAGKKDMNGTNKTET